MPLLKSAACTGQCGLSSSVACAGAQSRAVCVVRAGVNLGYGNLPVTVPHVTQAQTFTAYSLTFSVYVMVSQVTA